MKIKKLLASVIASAMVIAMMPNMSMVAHASGPCETCGHAEGEHAGEGDSCMALVGGDGALCDCTSYQAPTPTHTHNSDAYGSNATQHWTKCTDDSDNNGMVVEHTWSNGQCSVCSYTCNHGEATTGICVTCSKDLDGGSSGGGGSCEPEAPAPAPSVSKEPSPSPSPVVEEKKAEAPAAEPAPSEPAEETPVVDETKLPVELVAKDTTAVTAAISSVVPGATTYNLSQFKTTKGFALGIDKAVKAEQKKNFVAAVPTSQVEIFTGKPQTFGKDCISVLKNSNVAVVYSFMHKGHLYRVTIPAGTDITNLLDKHGFAGPLYIGKALGTTVLVK